MLLIPVCIVIYLQLSLCESSFNCQPGFLLGNRTTSNCSAHASEKACLCNDNIWKCYGKDSHSVMCHNTTTLEVGVGYCLTCDSHFNESETVCWIGPCPYNLYGNVSFFSNLSALEDSMCAPFHRKGQLCGECLEDYGPSIARSMHCKRCSVKASWLKYLFLQIFLPSTVLCVVIMACNLQFSNSPLNALILFFQVIFNVMYYDSRLHVLIHHDHSRSISTLLKLLMAIYGIFNLDFHYIYSFHGFSQVCFSHSTKGIHILMLKYLEAFNPLIYVCVLSLCVYLHNKHCMPVVLAWKGFRKVLTAMSLLRRMNQCPSMHLMNVFIAFLILGYSKILFVSLNLLIPSKVFEIREKSKVKLWTLYFDPTVEYFGREHTPYAITAIAILCIFIIFPLVILVLYPFKPFGDLCRRMLHSYWNTINYFIDAFQGWFKNGIETSSRDYRIVFAVFPVLKIFMVVFLCIFTATIHRGSRMWLGPSIVLQGIALFFAICRPYKVVVMNVLDSLIFSVMCTITLSMVNTGEALQGFTLFLAYLPMISISVYFLFKFFYWIKTKQPLSKCCTRSCLHRHDQHALLNDMDTLARGGPYGATSNN